MIPFPYRMTKEGFTETETNNLSLSFSLSDTIKDNDQRLYCAKTPCSREDTVGTARDGDSCDLPVINTTPLHKICGPNLTCRQESDGGGPECKSSITSGVVGATQDAVEDTESDTGSQPESCVKPVGTLTLGQICTLWPNCNTPESEICGPHLICAEQNYGEYKCEWEDGEPDLTSTLINDPSNAYLQSDGNYLPPHLQTSAH
jgi:hypothetical protein